MKLWTMPSCYLGETWEGWYVAPIAHNRDSDCLTESNWRVQLAQLEPLATDHDSGYQTVQVVHEGHWAVGWVEWLAIHPSNVQAVELANQIEARYDDYPVLDEDDWLELEQEEAERIWADCYSSNERLEYIREHRSQFEFCNMADLIASVRGRYFSGCASELLA